LLDKFGGGGGGATSGEQVVANDHALGGLDGVFVDSSVSVPYSREYETLAVLAGSFLGFRTGRNPH